MTFRRDIQGLRAVAVLAVVLSHAGVGGFSGGYIGVDVFFVISGFLITSLLLREMDGSGRISIPKFYARRAMRLIPAATLVLFCTLVGAWLWLPPIRIHEFAKDALAAGTYLSNIRFAFGGTDYLASDNDPSPFQHFWSLAVEEHFYLIWPMIIIGAVWVANRSRLGRRQILALGLSMIVAVSLALSLLETHRSASWAYFGTHTRIWELAVGALLALFRPNLRNIRPGIATSLSWIGLAAIVAAAVLVDHDSAYPGHLALLPVFGAGAVIAAGEGRARAGARVLLERGVLTELGRLSYGWYLWHWPMVIITPFAFGLQGSTGEKLLLSVIALFLAWLTYHLVENPLRHHGSSSAPKRAIGTGAFLTAAIALSAVTVIASPIRIPSGAAAVDLEQQTAEARNPSQMLAAAVLRSQSTTELPRNLTPSLAGAQHDMPKVYADGCHASASDVTLNANCVYGSDASKKAVVLFGDSHAAQWFPALERLAYERHWKLISFTKSGCTAADVEVWNKSLRREYRECSRWRRMAIDAIVELKPSLVVVSSSSDVRLVEHYTSPQAVWERGWTNTFLALRRSGGQVVAFADTPHLMQQVPACLSLHPKEIFKCNGGRRSSMRDQAQRASFVGSAAKVGIALIDPARWICSTDVCPVVLDNVLVYRDSNHVSTKLAVTLKPLIGSSLPS